MMCVIEEKLKHRIEELTKEIESESLSPQKYWQKQAVLDELMELGNN